MCQNKSHFNTVLKLLASLVMSFKPFGSVKVEWPGKADGRHLHHPPKGEVFLSSPKGFFWFIRCYILISTQLVHDSIVDQRDLSIGKNVLQQLDLAESRVKSLHHTVLNNGWSM